MSDELTGLELWKAAFKSVGEPTEAEEGGWIHEVILPPCDRHALDSAWLLLERWLAADKLRCFESDMSGGVVSVVLDSPSEDETVFGDCPYSHEAKDWEAAMATAICRALVKAGK